MTGRQTILLLLYIQSSFCPIVPQTQPLVDILDEGLNLENIMREEIKKRQELERIQEKAYRDAQCPKYWECHDKGTFKDTCLYIRKIAVLKQNHKAFTDKIQQILLNIKCAGETGICCPSPLNDKICILSTQDPLEVGLECGYEEQNSILSSSTIPQKVERPGICKISAGNLQGECTYFLTCASNEQNEKLKLKPQCIDVAASRCDTTDNRCKECQGPADCAHLAPADKCEKTPKAQINRCVQCTKDTECTKPEKCVEGKCGIKLTCIGYWFKNKNGKETSKVQEGKGLKFSYSESGTVKDHAHLHLGTDGLTITFAKHKGTKEDKAIMKRWDPIVKACKESVSATSDPWGRKIYQEKFRFTWDRNSFFKDDQREKQWDIIYNGQLPPPQS